MDQELVAYLDGRFTRLGQELKRELGRELKQELGQELRQELRDLGQELRQELGQDLRRELGQELREGFESFRREIAASAAETRRYFDVVAEQLMSKLQVVAGGVIAVDEKLDRFRGEVGGEFRKVERRFLHLEARIIR